MLEVISKQLNASNLGMALSILGILLTIFFAIKGKSKVQVAYRTESENVIGELKPEFQSRIEMRYDDIKIPRLTRTTIFVWNCGNRTIKFADAAKEDPPRFVLKNGAQMIESKIIGMSARACAAKLKKANDTCMITEFDILEPTQGFAVMVLHTGLPDMVTVKGTVAGAGPLIKWDPNSPRNTLTHVATVAPLNLAIYVFAVTGAVSLAEWLTPNTDWAKVVAFFGSLALSAAGTELIAGRFANHFKKRDRPSSL